MIDDISQHLPKTYAAIVEATKISGFTMASDIRTCCLLRTLAASRPSGKFLELGTGTGMSASWILDGMDSASSLISIDNDPEFLNIAQRFLGDDRRLKLFSTDAGKWIENNKQQKFDFIFADTWHGKYLVLDEVLSMLRKGGIYILDDMLPQLNWPDGHEEKVNKLINYLDTREDLILTRQVWATGIIIACKK
jgi:predicted O-methyltransferase YrrM